MIDQDDIAQCIKDCENRESKLTDWERGFIQSIGEQWDRTHSLSMKQNESLENIWNRVT